jgi:hypothetical protein
MNHHLPDLAHAHRTELMRRHERRAARRAALAALKTQHHHTIKEIS